MGDNVKTEALKGPALLEQAMDRVERAEARELHVVQAAALNTILQAKLAAGASCALNADDIGDAHKIVTLVTSRLPSFPRPGGE